MDVTAPRGGAALAAFACGRFGGGSIEEIASAGPVLDAEITANRPDCLGHYGIAREIAAIYRLPVKPVRAEAEGIDRKGRGRHARRNRIARIFAGATRRGSCAA